MGPIYSLPTLAYGPEPHPPFRVHGAALYDIFFKKKDTIGFRSSNCIT